MCGAGLGLRWVGMAGQPGRGPAEAGGERSRSGAAAGGGSGPPTRVSLGALS